MLKDCTIVVLNYNNVDFIDECLSSVSSVSREYNVDCVLIDDASTDGSQQKISKFSDQFNRTPTIIKNKKNIGINASIKKIFEFVQTEYVKVLASDDIINEQGFAAYWTEAKLGWHDLIVSKMTIIDEQSQVLGTRSQAKILKVPVFRDIHLVRNDINAASVMIRTSLLERALLSTNARNSEDWPIWRMAVFENWKVMTVQYPLVFYRQNSKGLSAGFSSNRNQEKLSRLEGEMKILFQENLQLADSFLGGLEIQLQRTKFKSRGLWRYALQLFSIISPLRNAYRLKTAISLVRMAVRLFIFKLGIRRKINWAARAERVGRDAVRDSRTEEGLRNKITDLHTEQLLKILASRPFFNVVKPIIVLDFGGGYGRFAELVRKISSGGQIFFFDPTTEFNTMRREKYDKYFSDLVQLNKPNSIDLVFCFMVLGGLSKSEILSNALALREIVNPGGRCLLIENTNENIFSRNYRWSSRAKAFYEGLFIEAGWGGVDQIGLLYEAGDVLSVMEVY